MSDQWKIARERARCQLPGCPLPTAREYFAVLELPACVRRDLCEPCFARLEREHGGRRPIFWRARRQAGRKEPVLDLMSLRMLFDRLGESIAESFAESFGEGIRESERGAGSAGERADDTGAAEARDAAAHQAGQQAAGLRYLVALLLLRKRMLKMTDPAGPEQEGADLVVIDPKVPDMKPVALWAPELDTDRLAALKDELMAALGEAEVPE